MTTSLDLDALAGRLRRHVEVLAASPRPPDSPAHRRAREYIAGHLARAGFSVQEDSHSRGGDRCINLLTTPFPEQPDLPLVVVGAHYDSLSVTPGADDNASAVAALLELAAWCRDPPGARPGDAPRARLQLAAYDLEEAGLVGSSFHARHLRKSGASVRGMISLEMLGYTDARPGSQNLPPGLRGLYPDVGNFIGVCGNERSRGLVETTTAGLKTVAALPVEFIVVPGAGGLLPEVRLSDHSAFWDQGFRALMITDTSFFRNPHYHQATDTPDTLDYPFLARVAAGVCAAVRRLLQADR
jgi:Zn-dependent M28 family amino/carboxypeptidase